VNDLVHCRVDRIPQRCGSEDGGRLVGDNPVYVYGCLRPSFRLRAAKNSPPCARGAEAEGWCARLPRRRRPWRSAVAAQPLGGERVQSGM
jgi:hypothetical protein